MSSVFDAIKGRGSSTCVSPFGATGYVVWFGSVPVTVIVAERGREGEEREGKRGGRMVRERETRGTDI